MLALTIFLTLCTNVWPQPCYLSFDYKSPITLNKDLVFPEVSDIESYISFEVNETFHVQCPEGTYSDLISKDGEEVMCLQYNNIVKTETSQVIDYRDIICKKRITITKKLTETCVNNGSKIQIGFDVRQRFIPVILVCFDEVKLTPIYVEFNKTNFVNERSYDYNEIFYMCSNASVCDFIDGVNIYQGLNLDDIYTNQEKILQSLGVTVELGNYLLRGELAVDALFYDPIQRYASLDYANIVPMWDRYHSSWATGMVVTARVENMVTFYGGPLGVASLPNSDGGEVELYLNNGQIPVPKWLWYLVYNQTDAYAYLVYNYPHSVNQIVLQEEWEATICDGGSFYGYTGDCPMDLIKSEELKTVITYLWPRKQ